MAQLWQPQQHQQQHQGFPMLPLTVCKRINGNENGSALAAPATSPAATGHA